MTKKWLVVMLITALIFLPVGISPSVDQRLYAQEHPVEQANPEDFIEILQTLDDPLPATSYVSQDVVPDKKFTLTLTEGDVYLGNDVLYTGFTIDGRIPGPTLIVNQNDIVEIEVVNAGQVPHGMSIHAAYTQTSKYVGQIGAEPKSVKFKATYPGVYMYHCAPGGHAIPMHTLFGQYGMIVVLPDGGYELEKSGGAPDVELFLIQHEMYATGKEAIEGDPMYVMFNGQLFRYLEEPIDVIPGDFVRIYFLNIGPNIISTLHIVGVIWEHVYWQGHPENVMVGGQTVLAGPSDSWVIDFRIPPDEGSYLLVTHAFGSTTRGAIGAFNAKWDHEDVQKVHLADGPTHTPEELAVFRENAKRIISPYDISELDEPVVHYPGQGKKAKVEIIGNSFHPKILKVPVGTEVEWVNEDVFAYFHGEYSGKHDVMSTTSNEFGSPMLAHGDKFSHTFNEVGEFEYICSPHPYMKGKIIVYDPADEDMYVAGVGSGLWYALPFTIAALIAIQFTLVTLIAIPFVLRRMRLVTHS